MLLEIYKRNLKKIFNSVYNFKVEKQRPSEWVEENIYLTQDLSRFTGPYRYDFSPYVREVIDCLDPASPVEMVAIMKGAQSGFTMGLVIPGIAYTIAENPAPILYTAADVDLVKLSVRTRLDPLLQSSGLSHLIRPNVVKKKNQRTGDTDFSKEFAGGSLTALGTNNPSKWRQYSVKTIFADDWDSAPRSDKKEGSVRSLMENRAKSYGTLRKLFYISTPTIKGESNIEEVFQLGDQRKWNWECPICLEYIPIEWRVEKSDGTYGGIKWDVGPDGKLIEDSVRYECQCCGESILEKDKYELNKTGKWIPTATPERPNYRSYQLNSLVIPPGFTSWTDLVYKWIEIHKDGKTDLDALKAFVNTELGQTWEDRGAIPDANTISSNIRDYEIGVVPDELSIEDGNGEIKLITLACDLGGIMNEHIEDVRLDYEIVAHTSNKTTYRIDHGSIGTFKRNRKKSQAERDNNTNRELWSYRRGSEFCVWDKLDEIINTVLVGTSGSEYQIGLTLIDTGNFTKLAYQYLDEKNDPFIIGVKGKAEESYRKHTSDTVLAFKSREMHRKLYIVQTNQLKDILEFNMNAKMGDNGYQPAGFMNYPTPSDGKYTRSSYFQHFEGEHRVEVFKNGVSVGYVWKKKHGLVENHFFDTSVYTVAAPYILVDIYRTNYPKYQKIKLSWEDYCELV